MTGLGPPYILVVFLQTDAGVRLGAKNRSSSQRSCTEDEEESVGVFQESKGHRRTEKTEDRGFGMERSTG